MKDYRAYVVPNALVGEKTEMLVLRTQLFTAFVLGRSPDARVAYEVKSKGGVRDWKKLFGLLSRTAEKSEPAKLEDNLAGFCKDYDLEITRLIPVKA